MKGDFSLHENPPIKVLRVRPKVLTQEYMIDANGQSKTPPLLSISQNIAGVYSTFIITINTHKSSIFSEISFPITKGRTCNYLAFVPVTTRVSIVPYTENSYACLFFRRPPTSLLQMLRAERAGTLARLIECRGRIHATQAGPVR